MTGQTLFLNTKMMGQELFGIKKDCGPNTFHEEKNDRVSPMVPCVSMMINFFFFLEYDKRGVQNEVKSRSFPLSIFRLFS